MSRTMTIVSRQEAIAAGLRFYFTGKPCLHGHIAPRYTKRSHCLMCNRISTSRWIKENPEKACVSAKKYYDTNRNTLCAKFRQWAKANQEKKRTTNRAWRVKNLERVRATSQKWAERNRERLREIKRINLRNWRLNNPEKSREKRRVHEHIRRSRKRASGGIFTSTDLQAIRKRQRNRCAELSCRRLLKGNIEHIDHIVPLARGGSNWPSNLQLLCRDCNQSKGALDPIIHAQRQGRLI